MCEKYCQQLGENTERGIALRELEEQLKAKHSKNRELYAMLSHIIDWNPKCEYWERPETVVRFEADMAKARKILEETE